MHTTWLQRFTWLLIIQNRNLELQCQGGQWKALWIIVIANLKVWMYIGNETGQFSHNGTIWKMVEKKQKKHKNFSLKWSSFCAAIEWDSYKCRWVGKTCKHLTVFWGDTWIVGNIFSGTFDSSTSGLFSWVAESYLRDMRRLTLTLLLLTCLLNMFNYNYNNLV